MQEALVELILHKPKGGEHMLKTMKWKKPLSLLTAIMLTACSSTPGEEENINGDTNNPPAEEPANGGLEEPSTEEPTDGGIEEEPSTDEPTSEGSEGEAPAGEEGTGESTESDW
jgi:hypothetical protein